MDCQCCFSEQSQYQEEIKSPSKVFSQRNLNQIKYIKEKNNYSRNDQHKISLRKKTQFLYNSKIINQIPIRLDNVKATTVNIVQHNNFQHTIFRPNSFPYQPKVYFNKQPPPQTIKTQFIKQPLYKRSPNFSYNQQIIKSQQFHAPVVNKKTKPEVKIFYQTPNLQKQFPSGQRTILNTKQFQPIKVSFNQGASPTMAEYQIVPQSFTDKQRKIPIRKSSIQLNQITPKNQQFRGKRSHIQPKKISSLIEDYQPPQAQYHSTAFVRSLKLNVPHIQDLQCKNTQSIADENDSIDQLSEVIRQNIEYFDELKIHRKMTNSDIKPSPNCKRNQIENKRSIIWQSSRKQSFNEI